MKAISFFARRLSVQFFIPALLLLPAGTLAMNDPQNLRTRFNTDSTAADFIFVVNTSSALSDAGVFSELRVQLSQVVAALTPIDNFILIGFDDKAMTIASACPVGDNRLPWQSAILKIKDPRGAAGSLRKGVDAALTALRRPGHAPLQFLFLILDGSVAPRQQARASADSLNGEALAGLAADWRGTSITEAHGLVVGQGADLQILRLVFPDIRFAEASPGSLRGFFERWRVDVPARKLRLQLADEMSKGGLAVHPVGYIQFRDDETLSILRIRVRSRFRKLPILLPHIGEWSIFPSDMKVSPRYEDFPLRLEPGESRDLRVSISRKASSDFFGCWHGLKRDTKRAHLSFFADIRLIDQAMVRNAGLEEPAPFMYKFEVESRWQHGQAAWLWLLVISTSCLMAFTVVVSRRLDLDAIAEIKAHWERPINLFRKSVSRIIPAALKNRVNISNEWRAHAEKPGFATVAAILLTLGSWWAAERWLGKSILALFVVSLFAFWSYAAHRLAHRLLNEKMVLSSLLRKKVIRPAASHSQPSLSAIGEE
jgi:hypothetical protein